MAENHVYHLIAWVITMIIISCVTVLGIWTINTRHYNDFKDEATTIIQRSGGLTQDAQKSIKLISDERYRDQFEVTTQDNQEYTTNQVSTGGTITYVIHVKLRILNIALPETTRLVTTTSMIRADSQPYRSN